MTPDSLTYNVVDLSLNNGFGDVTVKNIGLLKPATEKLAATYHSNGTDVWVIGHKSGTADYYSWLVTAAGVNPVPVISTVGIVYSGNFNDGLGYLKVSPCGNKMAAAVSNSATLELFDFDNSTGIISNPVLLGNWSSQTIYGPYGIEFSPDNSKLYAMQYRFPVMIQYNLLAGSNAAIIASADSVAVLSGMWGGALQTGPDGRIYFAKFQTSFLGCINFPNLLGQACNLVDNYIPISPSAGRPGLPNFPSSYFCNLNVNTTAPATINSINNIYPNPATTTVNLSLNASTTGSTQISIANMLGEIVYSSAIPASASAKEITIPLTNFQKGVYILKVQNKNGVVARKFFVN